MLEVQEVFFVLSDLRPLARQLHLHRGRDRMAQAHALEALDLVECAIKVPFEHSLVSLQAIPDLLRRNQCSDRS